VGSCGSSYGAPATTRAIRRHVLGSNDAKIFACSPCDNCRSNHFGQNSGTCVRRQWQHRQNINTQGWLYHRRMNQLSRGHPRPGSRSKIRKHRLPLAPSTERSDRLQRLRGRRLLLSDSPASDGQKGSATHRLRGRLEMTNFAAVTAITATQHMSGKSIVLAFRNLQLQREKGPQRYAS
jgi:hypothetical protein